jgi:hypothetical protein
MKALLFALLAALALVGPAHAADCSLPKYPVAACVGVPAGTNLQNVSGNITLSTAGQVYDAKNVSGAIIVKADDVTIKRTQVGTFITNESGKNLTVEDSTIGPTTCSNTNNGSGGVGLGWKDFIARRVYLRGNVDGVRIGGSNVLVQDSLIVVCSVNPDDHSDGVQAYGAQGAKNIKLVHNTWDQRAAMNGGGYTAPIFFPNDKTSQLNTGATWDAVNDNLLAGGTMSLRIFGDAEPWVAKEIGGNKIVDKSWYYAPTDVTCSNIEKWHDNAIVKFDWNAGAVTSEVKKLTDCTESGG